MDITEIRQNIAVNISAMRNAAGLTQAQFAEKLNYTDKAISKWERGESVPDLQTLVQLAELFDITVNDLLVDPDALPEDTGAVERVMGRAVEKTLKRKADKRIILGLSSLLVWFVALLLFVILSTLEVPKSWVAFFYAIPADAIVLLSLRSAWRDFRWNQGLISAIMWGSLMSIYVTLLTFFSFNAWRIFLLGVPGQIAILLWFRLYHKQGREEADE